VAAEALHKSIIRPLLAFHSEHYQALRSVLLKSIETITGKKAEFIQWTLTGAAQPREKPLSQVPKGPAALPREGGGTKTGDEGTLIDGH
jgi:hypothetical protein